MWPERVDICNVCLRAGEGSTLTAIQAVKSQGGGDGRVSVKFTCCITQPVLMILQFNLSSTAALGRAVRNIHTLGCSSAHRDAQRDETESGLAVSLFIQYLLLLFYC